MVCAAHTLHFVPHPTPLMWSTLAFLNRISTSFLFPHLSLSLVNIFVFFILLFTF